MNTDLSSIRGRSVFVTGHTGFKGAWLTLWLDMLGARVTGYSLPAPTQPSHFELAGVRDLLVREHEADLRDRASMHRAIAEARPDVVLHLAAQSVVRAGYRDPYETFDVNVMGTASVLDAVRAMGRPCAVVVVTTDKSYENREHVWGYRENDAMGGHDPYSASKGACELLVSSYRRSYFDPAKLHQHGVKLATARAGNVIGGGDWTADALVPDLVRSLQTGRPLELRSPKAIRPWQHVLDALSGYLSLATAMLASDDATLCDGWNFGPLPGNEWPVGELVDEFIAAFGEGSWRDVSDPNQLHEAQVLRLCIDKAMWELGWRPRWNVVQAIRHTAEWYRSWRDGSPPVIDITRGQIEEYTAAGAEAVQSAGLLRVGE